MGTTADAGRLALAPDVADPGEALLRVRSGDCSVRIEACPRGGTRDLAVRGDVLALADEGLVERVLELA